MKLQLFAFLTISILSISAFAQKHKQLKSDIDYVSGNSIYLQANQLIINIDNIKQTNIRKYLGKPLSIEKIKNEATDAQVTKQYTYKAGNIIFEDKELTDIEIIKTGWAFLFKNTDSFTIPIRIGTKTEQIKKLFSASWALKDNAGIHIGIKQPNGYPADEYIFIKIKNNIVIAILLFADES